MAVLESGKHCACTVPMATTLAAADLFLTSPLLYVDMGEEADVLEAGTEVLGVGAAQPRSTDRTP